jgi:cellulose synthase (UDP-forming)
MQVKSSRLRSFETVLFKTAAVLLLVFFWQNKTLLYDVAAGIASFYVWLREQFDFIGNFEGDWMVAVPSLLVFLFTLLGMTLFRKPPTGVRFVIICALIFSHTVYILFRTLISLQFNSIGSGIVTIFFWFSELVIYVCSLSLYVQLMFPAYRSKMADAYEKSIVSGEYKPWVDIFIPTYTEPAEIVKRTVIGCQAIDYENKRVYILDDGRRPELKMMAQELNCFYVTRTDNTHAKAGNINNALCQTDGELIAMFDADCVPLKNFLLRTVGFFRDDNVALVSTRQSFYNIDMFNHNIMSLMEESRFFSVTQAGRDRFNALLCFGTCFVMRRRSVEDIGGVPTETLSEDWALGIKLQAAGYRTYSLDEVLGVGAVAESMSEFLRQRVRWTQGTLQSLYASTNPLRIKGLTLMQRMIHSYSIMHYLINPFYLLIIIVPLLYFFFGFSPFYVTRGQFWFFFVPFICLNAMTMSWFSREYASKLNALVAETFICLPLTFAMIKTLIRPFGWRFQVTRKGIYRSMPTLNWYIAFPLGVFLILLIAGIFYGFNTRYWYGSEELFYFLFYWAIARVLLLWMGIYAAHDQPQQRSSTRFPHKLKCSFCGDILFNGVTQDISESGLLIKADKVVLTAYKYTSGLVSLPSIGLYDVPAVTVRINKGNYISVAFDKEMPLAAYRSLVEFIYCLPRDWDRNDIDRRTLNAMIKALTFDFLHRPKQKQVKEGMPA